MEYEPPVFLLAAQIDFDRHYSQLGDAFYQQCDEALSLLRRHPFAGPVYCAPYRKLMIRSTPIAIFYALEGKRIMVHGLLDLRQDPNSIAKRLTEE